MSIGTPAGPRFCTVFETYAIANWQWDNKQEIPFIKRDDRSSTAQTL